MKYLIEACTNSIQSTIEAEKGGAGRVELCDNLYEGGTTPSPACIELACSKVKIPVYVMIRPRGGDFMYSDLEIEIMKRDIEFSKQLGAAGVVFGVLCSDGSVNVEQTKDLTFFSQSLGLGVTFHRAFDMVNNPEKALEDIIFCGCERILTSGGENKAYDGRHLIKRMVDQAKGRIRIMAGSGINPANAEEMISYTGITEIHMSGKHRIPGGMQFKNEKIRMGGLPEIPEYEIEVTNAESVRKVYTILKQI